MIHLIHVVYSLFTYIMCLDLTRGRHSARTPLHYTMGKRIWRHLFHASKIQRIGRYDEALFPLFPLFLFFLYFQHVVDHPMRYVSYCHRLVNKKGPRAKVIFHGVTSLMNPWTDLYASIERFEKRTGAFLHLVAI